MKNWFIGLAIVFLMGTSAQAAPRIWGLGLMVGEPTGVSGKMFLEEDRAIDVGLGWSFAREAAFHLHSDYLWHERNLFEISTERFDVFYGPGVRVKAEEKFRFGLRFAGGVSYEFRTAPVELFVELAPVLDFFPNTELSMNGGVGGRYYF